MVKNYTWWVSWLGQKSLCLKHGIQTMQLSWKFLKSSGGSSWLDFYLGFLNYVSKSCSKFTLRRERQKFNWLFPSLTALATKVSTGGTNSFQMPVNSLKLNSLICSPTGEPHPMVGPLAAVV